MLIKLNNIELYYEEYGSGRPLIMLHGNGENHEIFNKLIPLISSHFRLILVDSRGHGRSSRVGTISYDEMALDIYELINKLRLQRPIIYGFSDGGIIALLLSINYPNLLSRIIISGANINPRGLKWPVRIKARLDYLFKHDILSGLMLYEPNITKEMLNKIEIPTNILVGEHDCIKLSQTKIIHNEIKNSTLKIVKAHNHSSYIINSEELYYEILDYLKMEMD